MTEYYVRWRLLFAIELKSMPLEHRESITYLRASTLQYLYEKAMTTVVLAAKERAIDPTPIELSATYCLQLFSKEIPSALNEENCSWPRCLANMEHDIAQCDLETINLGEARMSQVRSEFGLVSSRSTIFVARRAGSTLAETAKKLDAEDRDEQKANDMAKDMAHETEGNQPLRLTPTMETILKTCRQGHFKGETLANKVGLEYNYARRVFAKLVKAGKLRNDPTLGYRTV